MRKNYLLVASLLALPTLFSPGRSLYAQTLALGQADPSGTARIETSAPVADIPVSGRVTGDNGEGLPGVSVLVKGTTNGTTTDVEGRYKLTAPENATLVFSFIGYVTEEQALGNRTQVDVQLVTDIKALSEVVVVGYGTQKKETATGSITSVKGADVVQTPITNVTNSLAGRLPGVSAVTRSGEPGYDGSTIRIRGANSLGNNDALIVVDGIPGRSLERIDPNSIESITVLKDASAAIYGSQAANGVILVTTKRGKVGKPEIQFNLNQGYGRPTRVPQMASSAEYATMLNEIDVYRDRTPRYKPEEIELFRNGSDPWKYPNTDWFDAVLKPWSGQAYGNLTISGGSENLRYFLLAGAKNQDGYYHNSATRYTQYDFRSNLDGKISKHVSIGFDIAGRQENRFYPTRGAGSIFWMTMRGKPQMQAYWPNGTPGPDIEYGDNPAVISTDATGYDRDKRYVLNSNAKLNIEIPGVRGLSINANVGLDKTFRFRKRLETPWYLYSWDNTSYDANGEPVLVKSKKGYTAPNLEQSMEDNGSILLNALVNYDRQFGVHGFKFMAGTERRQERGDNFSAFRRNLMSPAIDQLFTGSVDDFQRIDGKAYQRARLNYFGRVNYNFSEKYLAEFVWRYDGTYQFRGKRYGFFPGVSLGWRISEENFWKSNVTFIDNLKLRGSWGQTGNDRMEVYINGQPVPQEWNFMSIYDLNYPVVFGFTEQNRTLAETRIGYPSATWEVANQSNVGFEAQLFNSRLSIESDFFYNIRSGILWKRNASIPQTAGFAPPYENIGKVANRGWEFNVTYNNEIGALRYRFGVNGGYAKNKILFWDEAPGAPEWQQSTGHPMNTGLYYQSAGIFRDQAQVDATEAKWSGARPGDVIFADIGGVGPDGKPTKVPDGKIDSYDRVRIDKTDLPRFTGGASMNLQWKGFDLDVLFQAATGAVRYISTESGEIGNFTKDFYDNRWTPENPGASQPRTFNRGDEYWRNQGNTHFLQNTDYLRLKNLVFGYTLPNTLTKRVGIQGVRFYVSGFNILTFSPGVKDFDPESNSSNGTNYPLQKVLNGGLTITL
jgi:TonB-linked SusC/RagA family outer membrane protein